MSPPSIRLGIWQSIPSPVVSRYLATMGWEWVVLDMQHGSMSFQTAYECVQAIRAGGSQPLVRTAIDDPFEVQRALDLGAAGVVVPMVNALETARRLAKAAKYPPRGERSLGGDASFLQGNDYPERANDETHLLVQVEHIAAARIAHELMAIDGVDGCFVGPTDLALSMGLSRNDYRTDPAHREVMARIAAAANARGKLACVNTYDPADFSERIATGYRGLTFKSEVDLLFAAGEQLLQMLRSIRSESEPREQTP